MTKVNRRDVIRVGGVVFMSGAAGALQAFLTACGSSGGSSSSGSSSSSSSTSGSSGSSGSSSSSCSLSTNVTRGPYFVDNQSDPHISSDVVDASISQRLDISTDTNGLLGTQPGL